MRRGQRLGVALPGAAGVVCVRFGLSLLLGVPVLAWTLRAASWRRRRG